MSDTDAESDTAEGNNVVAVVASGALVKTIKSWLETHQLFRKHISRLNPSSFVIHTTLRTTVPVSSPIASQPTELTALTAPHSLLSVVAAESIPTSSPLLSFVAKFLTDHPPDTPPALLLPSAPKRSNIYPPLLLLPHNAFTTPAWSRYLTSHPSFLPTLASALGVTHIARNAPIAATSIIRSPSGLEFLHSPSSETLWVHTTQHGLHQTWAPEYTMFSRGNIREKARVLGFPGVAGAEVADLYAGIGYFVFCYLKAGARRVWCWEMNPWSVEALRRGCGMNGWSIKVVRGEEWTDNGESVVVFEESNEFAVGRMAGRKVGHVNMGLLPTSRGAYATAVRLLEEGGWAHVHENVGEGEVEEKRRSVVEEFERLSGGSMKCDHVERVKTFAPGVVHCVFDVHAVKL